ncbi:hypothetical protein PVAP13_9NG509314 [Panicum virgatum]|uniref:Uncharacterized protein n=1 Tax=Panicum virgatum TaxID=38727 RepID=A0A8T0MWK5_PANVG|nr:hypothetical protein PVAP13_9NG509314 [Panicum virgatum]
MSFFADFLFNGGFAVHASESERRRPRTICTLFWWVPGRVHPPPLRLSWIKMTQRKNKQPPLSPCSVRPHLPPAHRPISHGSARPRPIRPHRRRAPPFLRFQFQLQLFLPVPPRPPRRRRLPLSGPPLTPSPLRLRLTPGPRAVL